MRNFQWRKYIKAANLILAMLCHLAKLAIQLVTVESSNDDFILPRRHFFVRNRGHHSELDVKNRARSASCEVSDTTKMVVVLSIPDRYVQSRPTFHHY